jgi:hypothetical protein
MAMQTRAHSALESCVNVAVGWGVSLASQLVIFPFFDLRVSLKTNLWISVWFTLISLARSFLLRRIFTHVTEGYEDESTSGI